MFTMFLCVLFDVLSLLSCNDISFVPLLARKYSPPPSHHHRSRRRSQNATAPLAKRSQRREAIKDGFIRRLSRCGTRYLRPRGGGETPHMKGVGVLVGNFELNQELVKPLKETDGRGPSFF